MKGVKFNNIEFQRCQLGWRCEINFFIDTNRQLTSEIHTLNAYGKKGWHGFLGVIHSYLQAREKVKHRCNALQKIGW